MFGCNGLKNKKYCIFNKQYSKEEYEEMVPKLIEKMKSDGEWWEFFPISNSPFGYNETVAWYEFAMTPQEAKNKWYNWLEYTPDTLKVEKIIPASQLPDDIADIPDDILNWAVECEVTKRPFKILSAELEFYRKKGFPIPKRHPDQRHFDRYALRWDRKISEIKKG